ncbi:MULTISPECIES: hypothetical protein [unclassified Streptomyces]|uniref:hypothetical protein n=1 Tax=unclassified Streptomyces TaxID=2593676 RepID=UPI001C2EB8DB|nr:MULTISPECIES: hypothetical protein [unclassified Streptomyces]MBV1949128.1 hypothetical protein [Streptomyces sp. BV129]
MRAAAARSARSEAAGPLAAPSSRGFRSGTAVTVAELFPRTATATRPFEVPVGEHFDAVTLPRPAALEAVDLLGRFEPHPVGAAVCRAFSDEWVLILPPGSGVGLRWSGPAVHHRSGSLIVPPRAAGTDEDLRWARLGNEEDRAYTAPLLLHTVLAQLTPRRSQRAPARASAVTSSVPPAPPCVQPPTWRGQTAAPVRVGPPTGITGKVHCTVPLQPAAPWCDLEEGGTR